MHNMLDCKVLYKTRRRKFLTVIPSITLKLMVCHFRVTQFYICLTKEYNQSCTMKSIGDLKIAVTLLKVADPAFDSPFHIHLHLFLTHQTFPNCHY